MFTGLSALAPRVDKLRFNVLFTLSGNLVSLESTGSIDLEVDSQWDG